MPKYVIVEVGAREKGEILEMSILIEGESEMPIINYLEWFRLYIETMLRSARG